MKKVAIILLSLIVTFLSSNSFGGCDLNHDGLVGNKYDEAILKNSFGLGENDQNYDARADLTGDAIVSQEDWNAYKQSICPKWGCDLNGDSILNTLDENILRTSFNLKEGEEGYDERADLNWDNIISQADAQIFNSGSCPTALVSSGHYHACSIVSGAAKCWGTAGSGKLGNGSISGVYAAPVQVVGLTSGVTAISAGEYHSCAIVDGSAKCWGNNSYGQLGNGTTVASAVPVQVAGLTSQVTSISVGNLNTCAIVGGSAKCWGNNSNGQLGNGTTVASAVPVQVAGLTSQVTSISAGNLNTCAIVGGSAKCWGNNSKGQLGNGTTVASAVPVQVVGLLTGVTALSAKHDHNCAVIAGAAKCWGAGSWAGELGDGNTISSSVPVQVFGLTNNVTSVSVGVDHSCALVINQNYGSAAKCWGRSADSFNTNQLIPHTVTGLASRVNSISSGNLFTCVVVGGRPKCWGYGVSGQLGDGASTTSGVPVNVLLP